MTKRTSNSFHLTPRRQELRVNSTPQEKILWSRIKNNQLGYKFRRQHSFGKFIVDFYCPEKKLIIEIDGSQHLENKEYDSERDIFLRNLGLNTLRFWNDEINTNIAGVVMEIEKALRG